MGFILFLKPLFFGSSQKHEDESESWLHRQVRDEKSTGESDPAAVNNKTKVDPQAEWALRRLLCVSAERTSALLQRWTQVFLHQSHPSGWEREVLPHLHVHLSGKHPQKNPVFAPSLGFTLLVLFQPNTSTDILQSLTSGDWDVTKILAYNHEKNLM